MMKSPVATLRNMAILLLAGSCAAFSLSSRGAEGPVSPDIVRSRIMRPNLVVANLKAATKLDFSAAPFFKLYRTAIRYALQEGVNFSGRFVVAELGCGTNCRLLAVIDPRSGKVYPGPPGVVSSIVDYCADSPILAVNPPWMIEEDRTWMIDDGESPPPDPSPSYFRWDGRHFVSLNASAECGLTPPSQQQTIDFPPDSSVLTPLARRIVSSRAEFLRACPEYTMVMVGHVGPGYSFEHAMALSQHLANTVIQAIVKKGVAPRQLHSEARGKEEALGHRVQLVLRPAPTDSLAARDEVCQ